MTADLHPAVAQALAAIRALATYQPTNPADLAHLIESTAGDGTGATSLVTELTRVVHAWTHTPALADLHPADAADTCSAIAYWRITVDHAAGEYAATALDLLDQADTVPVVAELAEATA